MVTEKLRHIPVGLFCRHCLVLFSIIWLESEVVAIEENFSFFALFLQPKKIRKIFSNEVEEGHFITLDCLSSEFNEFRLVSDYRNSSQKGILNEFL